MSARPAPPGGWPPPSQGSLAGAVVELEPLAQAVAVRYFERFPEDLERYGDVAREWEVHDTQHLLGWAIGDAEGFVDLEQQALWLARVLAARDFPLEHLAVNLELAAEVVAATLAGGAPVATRLRGAAGAVRAVDQVD